MEKTIQSTRDSKQKRFLLVLPLLTFPFITLMFWALGGGKGSDVAAQSSVQQGLNLKLPDAKLKDDKTLNKLSFYDQAALDSAKTKEAEKLDPYWRKSIDDSGLGNAYNPGLNNSVDANQMKVYNKFDELKKALNNSQEAQATNYQSRANPYSLKTYSSSNDAERLQSMMQKMNEDKTQDPEISQLNDMLDKIQAIQNPDQTKNIVKPDSSKNLIVKNKDYTAGISLLKPDIKANIAADTIISSADNAFFSTTTFDANADSTFHNTIEAIIPETQTIVSGSTIQLALEKDVVIQHITIPAGTSVYGTTSLSNERLTVSVTSIRYQNSILPVAMNVYDMDGQEGIYIPGSINRTVEKESANNAISEMNPTTIDPSVGAQAMSAGIEAAKTLASRKIKLIKMTVRAGYKVLLKNNNDK